MDQIFSDVINNPIIQVVISFVLEKEKDMASASVRAIRNIRLFNYAAAGFTHGSEQKEIYELNRDQNTHSICTNFLVPIL